jgi:large subunit ribosomal protein L37Ae
MEITQHARYTCTFCGKTTVKRTSVGIWECKSCKKTVAGGAWVVSYVFSSTFSTPAPPRLADNLCVSDSTPAAAATRSTIRRLREIAEV